MIDQILITKINSPLPDSIWTPRMYADAINILIMPCFLHT